MRHSAHNQLVALYNLGGFDNILAHSVAYKKNYILCRNVLLKAVLREVNPFKLFNLGFFGGLGFSLNLNL